MPDPRLLTKDAAAEYCSLTPSGFTSWVKEGRLPRSIPGTHRWDRKAIDVALDRLSGIESDDASETPEAALRRWEEEQRSGAGGA